MRDNRWSEAIAVGSRPFVEKLKNELGCKAAHRELIEADGLYGRREAPRKLTDSNLPFRMGLQAAKQFLLG